jgi:hypothetical protein
MLSNMSYDEAAAVPFGAMEALHFLKQANIRSGERVLINGAGGSIRVSSGNVRNCPLRYRLFRFMTGFLP